MHTAYLKPPHLLPIQDFALLYERAYAPHGPISTETGIDIVI
jgi:hypothetical protein